MKTSSTDHVKEMYEATADAYSVMMDSEIDLPLYTEVLSRLQANLVTTSGVLIDTSCGSGHMLSMYRHQFDSARPLMGLDLSPSMVKIASGRLGGAGPGRVVSRIGARWPTTPRRMGGEWLHRLWRGVRRSRLEISPK